MERGPVHVLFVASPSDVAFAAQEARPRLMRWVGRPGLIGTMARTAVAAPAKQRLLA
jgi:hypothetical protein